MTQTDNANWTDEYIRPDPDNPGEFIVYDHKGEYIGRAEDRVKAVQLVIDYTMRLNGRRL